VWVRMTAVPYACAGGGTGCEGAPGGCCGRAGSGGPFSGGIRKGAGVATAGPGVVVEVAPGDAEVAVPAVPLSSPQAVSNAAAAARPNTVCMIARMVTACGRPVITPPIARES